MAAIDTVRGGTGYGDRPVHDHLSTRLPGDRKAEVEHAVSALDQSGLYQPLHAHVCDLGDGRQWAESQEYR